MLGDSAVSAPLDLRVDLSIHAATEYVAGHSEVLMGTVPANAVTWKRLDRANTVFAFFVGSDDAYQVLRRLARRLQIH